MSDWPKSREEQVNELEAEVDQLTDLYNQTESSRVHHAQRGDTYKLLLTEALEKLDEYSLKRYDAEVLNFEKEVNEWFEAFDYREEEDE